MGSPNVSYLDTVFTKPATCLTLTKGKPKFNSLDWTPSLLHLRSEESENKAKIYYEHDMSKKNLDMSKKNLARLTSNYYIPIAEHT